MLYVVIAFLFLSVILYILLGGADFGAGIVELFTGKKARNRTQNLMYESIAPVWEANHMWLIIAIVVVFVGFPDIYEVLSVYLHIPLVLMLLGIIARGTAFTFRNYDAIEDNWKNVYREVFYYSSLVTPFFIGSIAAATISGSINPDAKDFLSLYVYSWFNPFGIAVGVFTIVICGYLASIYSLREADSKADVKQMMKKTRDMMLAVFVSGGLVFVVAYFSEIPLIDWVFTGTVGIIAVIAATVSLGVLLWCINHKILLPVRALGAFQIIMIMTAASYRHIPNIILLGNGKHISLIENTAPESTLTVLGYALLIGCVFILPFLFYLMFSFSKVGKSGE